MFQRIQVWIERGSRVRHVGILAMTPFYFLFSCLTVYYFDRFLSLFFLFLFFSFLASSFLLPCYSCLCTLFLLLCILSLLLPPRVHSRKLWMNKGFISLIPGANTEFLLFSFLWLCFVFVLDQRFRPNLSLYSLLSLRFSWRAYTSWWSLVFSTLPVASSSLALPHSHATFRDILSVLSNWCLLFALIPWEKVDDDEPLLKTIRVTWSWHLCSITFLHPILYLFIHLTCFVSQSDLMFVDRNKSKSIHGSLKEDSLLL